MYVPAAYREDRPERLAALIAERPLATLVVNGPDGPVCAYAPLVLERDADGRPAALLGHVARANPICAVLDHAAPGVALFSGEDAYVSPSFYPSKAEHGRVVPTWNYVRVEARGRIRLDAEVDGIEGAVRRLTDAMETPRPQPWSVDDAPAGHVRRLSGAIVGVRLTIETLQGSWKMSQDKRDADFGGVLAGLSASAAARDVATAAVMAGLEREKH